MDMAESLGVQLWCCVVLYTHFLCLRVCEPKGEKNCTLRAEKDDYSAQQSERLNSEEEFEHNKANTPYTEPLRSSFSC